MSKLFLFLFLLACVGCTTFFPTRESWTENAFTGKFPESYGKLKTTPKGVRVDDAVAPVDLEKVDFIVDTVYECLQTEFPNGRLTDEEDLLGACFRDDHRITYPSRSKLIVKIGKYELSCDGKQEVLTVEAPGRGCDKGVDCGRGCRWRGGYREVDGKHMHIVTRSMYMLSHTLTSHMSACKYPSEVTRLQRCARPRVPRL